MAGHVIAVMNTKGGVGKSTTVMMLSEALATFHNKKILIVDSDPQTSVSIMMVLKSQWGELERSKKTLFHYLDRALRSTKPPDLSKYLQSAASDVIGAQSISLLAGHTHTALIERRVVRNGKTRRMASIIRQLINEARKTFDIILVDCPPGVSEFTETWLRLADFYLPPTKPDFLSARGLSVLQTLHSESKSRKSKFAENLGVLVSMKESGVSSQERWHQRLRSEPELRCFPLAIPKRASIQNAAECSREMRTFKQKYPKGVDNCISRTADELLDRIKRGA